MHTISAYKTLSGTSLIHQVPKRDSTSYRYMSNPPKQSPLQLLYPGRPLTYYDSFTGVNIPHQYPSEIEKTRATFQKNALQASHRIAAINNYLGGDGRLLAHPFVEPDVMVDDPILGINSLTTPNATPVVTGKTTRGPQSQYNINFGTPPVFASRSETSHFRGLPKISQRQ
jgi:hypothetical protein